MDPGHAGRGSEKLSYIVQQKIQELKNDGEAS